MEIVNQIITNKCIVVPFCLWIIIQVFKFVYELIVNKKIDFKNNVLKIYKTNKRTDKNL